MLEGCVKIQGAGRLEMRTKEQREKDQGVLDRMKVTRLANCSGGKRGGEGGGWKLPQAKPRLFSLPVWGHY